MMDELRGKRYNDKLDHIIASIKLITKKPNNELEKRGILYSLLTSIESIVDLIAMILKDTGIPVKDDESNILELVKRRKIRQELGEDLKKANGMRNIIVHRYNSIDEDIIFNSIKQIEKLMIDWVKIIEEILNEFTNNSKD